MSRIEHIGDATLYLGDCLDILPTLADPDEIDRDRSRRHADTVRAVWDLIADTLVGTE